jgi:hypothetical protein
VNHTALHFYFGENAFDSLGKTIEIVDTSNQNVGHPYWRAFATRAAPNFICYL